VRKAGAVALSPCQDRLAALRVGRWRRGREGVAALVALLLSSAPAFAQETLRIGTGFGLAFLPAYVCEDLKLVEKHAKDAHLDLKPSYQRFFGAGPLQQALAAGALDMAPFGTAPFLAAWEKGKDTPRQVVAVSGLTTLPLVLLTNRREVHSLADFRATDRIAIPDATAPQLYLLEMQSEKVFGQYDKLRGQIVVVPHPQAVADLMAGADAIAGYFSSAPFTEVALADGRIHKVLSAADVVDGKASLLLIGATKAYVAAHPKVADVVAKAIDEAARLIHDDPRRAAEIYLAHEPSKTFDPAALAVILADIKDDFGSTLYGVQAFAEFMARHGELKTPPETWKEIVVPSLLNAPNT
jgi:sulfonate transport system substrate-binding protein